MKKVVNLQTKLPVLWEDKFLDLFLASDESQNMNTEDEEFFALFSESSELQEEKQDSDKAESELDTLNENIDTMEDKFTTISLENDDLQEVNQDKNTNNEEKDTFDDPVDTMVDKFLTVLSEDDDSDEEKQDGNLDRENDDAFEESTDLMVEKFIRLLSETDESEAGKPYSNTNDAETAGNKEVEDEQHFRKNICFTDITEKEKTVTVKMPVLLTELETEVDIIETIDLLKPLNNILKIEWSIQSLDCQVVLPSKTAFLKGEFIATCEFNNKESVNKIQALKFFIPWSKTVNINWVTAPDFPFSNEKEFTFQAQHQHNANNHYEFHQKFSEPIQSQLKKSTLYGIKN